MKRSAVAIALVLAFGMLTASAQYQETVLYEFEVDGAYNGQGWGSFGVPTTDSGMTTDASVGDYARFHSFNMALGSWGIVDRSPSSSDASWGFGDLSGYDGIAADVKMTQLDPPTGIDTIELLLAIGYAEWTSFHPLTSEYQTISAKFDELIPQSSATDPITPEQLADPSLQIKLVLRRGEDTGHAVLRYDHIVAFIPEPASLTLLALAGLVGLRRR